MSVRKLPPGLASAMGRKSFWGQEVGGWSDFYGSRKPTGRTWALLFPPAFQSLCHTCYWQRLTGSSWESRKVVCCVPAPEPHGGVWQGSLQAERQNLIINLSIISHLIIQLSLILSSCLTTAANPPGSPDTTVSKRVLNFVDFFPSSPT